MLTMQSRPIPRPDSQPVTMFFSGCDRASKGKVHTGLPSLDLKYTLHLLLVCTLVIKYNTHD